MYAYEYEKIYTELGGWGPFDGKAYTMCVDYHEIIRKRAEAGWRYVGYIPTKQRGTGHVEELELVFEKEV